MKGLRLGSGLLLAALWAVSVHAQEPTGSIRGRVTDEASQLPLSGALVRVGNQNAQTSEDGTYQLTGVQAGTDTRRVSVPA